MNNHAVSSHLQMVFLSVFFFVQIFNTYKCLQYNMQTPFWIFCTCIFKKLLLLNVTFVKNKNSTKILGVSRAKPFLNDFGILIFFFCFVPLSTIQYLFILIFLFVIKTCLIWIYLTNINLKNYVRDLKIKKWKNKTHIATYTWNYDSFNLESLKIFILVIL